MLEKVFLVYFLTFAVVSILDKYKLIERFQKWAVKQRMTRFFYSVSECDFCMVHHLSIIPCLIVCFHQGFSWFDFFVPLMVTELNKLSLEWRKK